MTHQEALEILPLYAAGGLEDESAQALERHLAEPCRLCATELREWREVVGLLPLGLTPPGPDLIKERLKARIQQDGELVPAQAPAEPRARRRQWMILPLAAAVLLCFGGLRYYTLRQQAAGAEAVQTLLAQERARLAGQEAEVQQLRAQLEEQRAQRQAQQARLQEDERVAAEKTQAIAQLEATLAEQRQLVGTREQEFAALQAAMTRERTTVRDEIATLKAALARQEEALERGEQQIRGARAATDLQRGVIAVLSTPDLRVGALQPVKPEGAIRGHVVWNERRKLWLFYAFGLPTPPVNKEYQVWFITEKEGPVSAGLFRPDQAGTGIVLASSPTTALGNVSAVAVTLEPAGGLPKPSGEMYLRGSL